MHNFSEFCGDWKSRFGKPPSFSFAISILIGKINRDILPMCIEIAESDRGIFSIRDFENCPEFPEFPPFPEFSDFSDFHDFPGFRQNLRLFPHFRACASAHVFFRRGWVGGGQWNTARVRWQNKRREHARRAEFENLGSKK